MLPYSDLIEVRAKSYDIDPHWVMAIIKQESNWNPYAVRYEPNYRWLCVPAACAEIAHVTLDTETITQKMSWGLGQIMGALAREQKLSGNLGELLIPETNITHLCMRLKTLKKMSADAAEVFAKYNAGPGAKKNVLGKFSNQSYVDSVLDHLSHIQ